MQQLFQKFLETVPYVILSDLEGYQYWQRRKWWISQTTCSKVWRNHSGNYPAPKFEEVNQEIIPAGWCLIRLSSQGLKKKHLSLHSYKIKAVHEVKPSSSVKHTVGGFSTFLAVRTFLTSHSSQMRNTSNHQVISTVKTHMCGVHMSSKSHCCMISRLVLVLVPM